MQVVKQSTSGQKLWILLRHPDYSGLSVSIVKTTGTTLQTGTPTVASWTTTLSADCGEGATNASILDVADATGITPGWAFLVDTGGHWTMVEILSVDTTTKKVYLADLLQVGYDTGATLKPAEASLAYNTTVTDTEQKFYVNVSYLRSDTGKIAGWKESGYCTEHPALCPVSPEDLLNKWPNLPDLEFSRNRNDFLEDLLGTVFDMVRSKLWDRGQTVEMYKGAVEALKQVVIYECGWQLSESGINPLGNGTVADFQAAIQESRSASWVGMDNTEQWIDLDEDGAKDEYESGQGKEFIY